MLESHKDVYQLDQADQSQRKSQTQLVTEAIVKQLSIH